MNEEDLERITNIIKKILDEQLSKAILGEPKTENPILDYNITFDQKDPDVTKVEKLLGIVDTTINYTLTYRVNDPLDFILTDITF